MKEIKWRVLPWRREDAYTNMAIDKVVAESVAAGGTPTIRFYQWAGNGAVSYGASQAIADIDVAYCASKNIPYVRRFTEARAMYHGPHDLTYAIAAPLEVYANRAIIGAAVSSRILSFLEAVGVRNATQAGFASLVVEKRKISGSVPYYEQRKAIFQHGSIFSRIEYEQAAKACGATEEEIRNATTSLEERSDQREGIEALFQKYFLEGRDWQEAELTYEEIVRVDQLKKEFASEEWLLGGTASRGACGMHWGVQVPRFVTNLLGGTKN